MVMWPSRTAPEVTEHWFPQGQNENKNTSSTNDKEKLGESSEMKYKMILWTL